MSLLETLVAIFVLLGVFIIFATLYHWVLSSSKRADQAATAARLATNRLADLRAWAAQPNGASDNFHGSWTSQASPVEMEPGYQVSVDLLAAQIYAPSTQLETAFPRPREMSNACKRVRVRVRWGTQTFDLYSQLTAPPVVGGNVTVSLSSAATLAPGGTLPMSAQGLDTSGEPIDDLVYQWNVLPITGTGSITLLDRNGREAEFHNDDPNTVNGSELKVEVTASYRGRLISGQSAVITEDGP